MTDNPLDHVDVWLDASDPDFVERFREAVGAEPGDKINFVIPPHHRTDRRTITYFPRHEREYDALANYPDQDLLDMGCGIWERGEGWAMWLYPGEWFDYIPDGYPVIDIFGKRKAFNKEKASNDCRFGQLAYGFLTGVRVPSQHEISGIAPRNASKGGYGLLGTNAGGDAGTPT